MPPVQFTVAGNNCFASVPEAKDLIDKGELAYVGTIRKNKTENPKEMTDKSTFQHG